MCLAMLLMIRRRYVPTRKVVDGCGAFGVIVIADAAVVVMVSARVVSSGLEGLPSSAGCIIEVSLVDLLVGVVSVLWGFFFVIIVSVIIAWVGNGSNGIRALIMLGVRSVGVVLRGLVLVWVLSSSCLLLYSSHFCRLSIASIISVVSKFVIGCLDCSLDDFVVWMFVGRVVCFRLLIIFGVRSVGIGLPFGSGGGNCVCSVTGSMMGVERGKVVCGVWLTMGSSPGGSGRW